MSDLRLTPEQFGEWARCQSSLDALWEWMDSLDKEADKELARIVGDKINELLKKVQRRFGIQ